jgi:hypothetical protein
MELQKWMQNVIDISSTFRRKYQIEAENLTSSFFLHVSHTQMNGL